MGGMFLKRQGTDDYVLTYIFMCGKTVRPLKRMYMLPLNLLKWMQRNPVHVACR